MKNYDQNARMSCCELMPKNKSKSNSNVGGLFILAAGGYHIAWLLWNLSRPPYDNNLLFIYCACWYFGTIIGSILGIVLVNKWKKKNIYYLSGVMSIIGSSMFIIWFIFYITAIGRLLAGIAHGIALVTTLIHGAKTEEGMRGRLLSSPQFFMNSSALVFTMAMVYTNPYVEIFGLEALVGILPIVLALIGILFTKESIHESITGLPCRNEYLNESFSTSSEGVGSGLKEMKNMVVEDRERNRNIVEHKNLRPLPLMLALTIITALSTNLIMNTNLMKLTVRDYNFPLAALSLITPRYIASMLFIDSFASKDYLTILTGLSANILSALQILSIYDELSSIRTILLIIYQVFIGFIESGQHILISEAISTAKKYWSVAFIVIFESKFQIAMIRLTFFDEDMTENPFFIYVSCVGLILMAIFIQLKRPARTRDVFKLRETDDECVGKS